MVAKAIGAKTSINADNKVVGRHIDDVLAELRVFSSNFGELLARFVLESKLLELRGRTWRVLESSDADLPQVLIGR